MDGVLLIDKPPGITSHDVVAAVRRTLGGPRKGPGRLRVGHAGTLDPFASGLLLVLVGRATRVQSLLMALPKTYETVARLGALSSTGDPEGEITVTGRVPTDPPLLPTGELLQRPPAYSAVKVDGVRAYQRARRGETLELAERPVTVYRFEQLWREGDRAAFAIQCSAGTYVRSLVADLGDAYCEALRRTAIGAFEVAQATAPPSSPADRDALAERLMPIEQALDFLPRVTLDEPQSRRARHGLAITMAEPPSGTVLLVDTHGAVAVAESGEGLQASALKPVIGLRPD